MSLLGSPGTGIRYGKSTPGRGCVRSLILRSGQWSHGINSTRGEGRRLNATGSRIRGSERHTGSGKPARVRAARPWLPSRKQFTPDGCQWLNHMNNIPLIRISSMSSIRRKPGTSSRVQGPVASAFLRPCARRRSHSTGCPLLSNRGRKDDRLRCLRSLRFRRSDAITLFGFVDCGFESSMLHEIARFFSTPKYRRAS